MIGFHSTKNRFSLYYLEENELYIQDLSANVTFYDFKMNEEKYLSWITIYFRRERGKLHVCSRTLIFEPERSDLPL